MFIITGGGSGIGKSLALALAKRDQEVLIIGRRKHLLEETAAASPLIRFFCADVSTAQGLESIKEYVSDASGIKGLINNAGTIEPLAPITSIRMSDWQQALNTNLNAPLLLAQLLYPYLTNGRVLNMGSGAAYFPVKGWAAYCVSKAALSMLTQCWQLESDKVAFASVMPGITDTDMQAIAREGVNMDAEQVNFYRSLKQNKQLILPQTVAEFLVWLLLDVDSSTYSSKEWDIYDSSHHESWLRAPHQVPQWNS